jgi:hypothetical protein
MQIRKGLAALFLAAFACAPTPAQNSQNRYSATTGDVSLSGAGTTLTIQRPAAGANAPQVVLESATVYCSVACTFSQAYNGTAPTGTLGTATPIPPNTVQPATAQIYTASNVGAGTAVGGVLRVPAGTDRTIIFTAPTCASQPCPGMVLGGAVTPNYSITISSITGTANILLIWREQ